MSDNKPRRLGLCAAPGLIFGRMKDEGKNSVRRFILHPSSFRL
jgi:hypothetical protein